MTIGIIGMLIGAAVAAAGVYELVREKADAESRKIYGTIAAVGGVVFAAALVKLILALA